MGWGVLAEMRWGCTRPRFHRLLASRKFRGDFPSVEEASVLPASSGR